MIGFSVDRVKGYPTLTRLRFRSSGGSNIHVGYYKNYEYAKAQGVQILKNLELRKPYLSEIYPDFDSLKEIKR